MTLNVGETANIKVTVFPENDNDLTYSIDNDDYTIAYADYNGVVTAVSEGTTIITSSTYNGKRDSLQVTVVDPKKQV